MKIKGLALSMLLILIGYNGQGQKDITLEEIWKEGKFYEKGIPGFKHMQNGEFYTLTSFYKEDNAQEIIKYKYNDKDFEKVIFRSTFIRNFRGAEEFSFTSYKISPDERYIILAFAEERIYRHSTKAFYLVWDTKFREYKELSQGGKQMYPAFSPNSKMVGFVEDNNLYYMEIESGKVKQITKDGERNKIINGASDWVYEEEFVTTRAFAWAPNNKYIAFLKFDESEVLEYQMPTYYGSYPEPYKFKYPRTGEANSKVTLHNYILATGGTYHVNVKEANEHYIPRIKWTHEGDLLCFQVLNRHQNHLQLKSFNAVTHYVKTILSEKSSTYVDVNDDLTFLENKGDFIWTSDKSGYNQVYLYTMNGRLKKRISKGNVDVMRFYGVDEERGQVYYQIASPTALDRQVERASIEKTKRSIIGNKLGTSSATFSKGFNYYIYRHTDINNPVTYSLHKNDGELIRELRNNKELEYLLDSYNLSSVEFFTCKSAGREKLNGWMMKPVDFDEDSTYPVVMFVYGGPGSQTVQNVFSFRNRMWFEMLTQKGYIVASVDNRGTGGRGTKFKKQTYLKLGELETADQAKAAEHLGRLDFVDADRIGIFGWSYGGYMSSLCLLKHPSLFKMAIAVAPVTHWKFYDNIYTERFMRTPEENPKGYEAFAPINLVDSLRNPYLLVHGTGDDNVHFLNTTEMINSMNAANKKYDLLVYPDKAHGIGGSSTRLHLFSRMTEFILENL